MRYCISQKILLTIHRPSFCRNITMSAIASIKPLRFVARRLAVLFATESVAELAALVGTVKDCEAGVSTLLLTGKAVVDIEVDDVVDGLRALASSIEIELTDSLLDGIACAVEDAVIVPLQNGAKARLGSTWAAQSLMLKIHLWKA